MLYAPLYVCCKDLVAVHHATANYTLVTEDRN